MRIASQDTVEAKLNFAFKKKVDYGRGLYLLGNIPELGNWNPLFAVKMFWSEGDNWTQTVTLHIPKDISTRVEYKYIETKFDRVHLHGLVWENGRNRVANLNPSDYIQTSIYISSLSSHTNRCKYLDIRLPQEVPDFKKKRTPGILIKNYQAPDVYSLDCKGISFKTIKESTKKKKGSEMILLQNVSIGTLRSLWNGFQNHMAYFDEKEELSTNVIFYDFTKWQFIEGNTLNLPHTKTKIVWVKLLHLTTNECTIFISRSNSLDHESQSSSCIVSLLRKAGASKGTVLANRYIMASDILKSSNRRGDIISKNIEIVVEEETASL